MKQNLTFIVYNYISAAIMTIILIQYNIGFWPFEENLINKSYLPSNSVAKYFTVATLLIGQLLAFAFIVYVLVTQHRKINILFTNV